MVKITLPTAECDVIGRVLQNDFEALFTINGAPRDAVLFGSKDVEHCFFYLSPGVVTIARGLIQRFGGLPDLGSQRRGIHSPPIGRAC
jgi:hypothetical protein